MNLVGHIMGLDSSTGPWYLFWSGVAGNVALVGTGWAIVRKHTCNVHHCYRVALYPVDGTPYKACAKHHPDTPKHVAVEDLSNDAN